MRNKTKHPNMLSDWEDSDLICLQLLYCLLGVWRDTRHFFFFFFILNDEIYREKYSTEKHKMQKL